MSGLSRRLSSKIRSASGNLVGDKLKNLDAYPKTLDDFRIKTYTGAAGLCLDNLSFRARSGVWDKHSV